MQQTDVSLEALAEMVTRVQDELEDAPGTLPIRDAILERALKLLEKVSATPATTPWSPRLRARR